jgi:hypothetical protein
MSKTEAHALLNEVRAGRFPCASEATINAALRLTGDLDPLPFDHFGKPLTPLPFASHLNRSGRVMRGAGEVML